MRRAVLLTSALGAGMSLLMMGVAASQYPVGRVREPGPGFYPILVGVLFLIGSIGTGLEAWARRDQPAVEWPDRAAAGRVLLVGASLAVYPVVLWRLGYSTTTALLTVVILRAMGVTSWIWTAVVAGALSLGSYYLFVALLGVPLPASALGR